VLDLKPRLRKRAEENSKNSKSLSLEKFHKENVKNDSQSFESRRNETEQEKRKRHNKNCVDAQIGDIANISREQVRKIEKLKESCSDEEIKDLRSGKVKIHKKFTEKERGKREQTLKATEFPKGKYRVIYADPPWDYGTNETAKYHGDPHRCKAVSCKAGKSDAHTRTGGFE